jgi:hypothetical protein
VVPAGTVGGSVNRTAKVAPSTVGIAGMLGKFANIETAMITTAATTAARLYLNVHFRYIFLPLHDGKSSSRLKPTHFKVR